MAMRVLNAPAATAKLVLGNVRRIDNGVQPSNTPGNTKVTGLLNTGSTPMPTCRAMVGNPAALLTTSLSFSSPVQTILRVECPTARSLTLDNTNGSCLQAIWANAPEIAAVGNRSMVVHIDPQRTARTTINVTGMTSWGVPPMPAKASITNTRVIVRLSELQSDADKARSITILGQLRYKVAPYNAVLIIGCGATSVDCRVTDKDRNNVCRAVTKCTTNATLAKENALKVINSPNPCLMTMGVL